MDDRVVGGAQGRQCLKENDDTKSEEEKSYLQTHTLT